MSKTRIKTIACLTLLVCVALITSLVWAEATEEPVSCDFNYTGTHIAKQWIDDDGVLHLRDITYGLTSIADSGNMEMQIAGVCNHNYDMVNGGGDYWGDDQTIEVTIGELSGIFRGSHSGIRSNHTVGHSTHIYQGISGDFVGCKLRLNGTFNFAQKNGSFEGVLHNPKGE